MVGMEKRIEIQEELGIRIFPRMQDVGMNVCRNTKARKAKKKIFFSCIKKKMLEFLKTLLQTLPALNPHIGEFFFNVLNKLCFISLVYYVHNS